MAPPFRYPISSWGPALLIAITLIGCAPAGKNVVGSTPAEPLTLPIWPSPPDPPRYIFETVLRSLNDIYVRNDDERLQTLLTGRDIDASPVFLKPGAVAARGGKVYVADTNGSAVVVFDAPRRRVFRFGQRKPGTIAVPSGLALDKNGMVYVADSKNRAILVFDDLGLYQRSIGDKNSLQRPVGVAVDSERDRVYVVDRGSNDSDEHRLVAFRGDDSVAWQIGGRGKAPGQFNVPLQVSVTSDGTIHVLDSGNFRVQSFSPEGKFLRTFGSVGINLGNLWRPRGLAADNDGRIYVSDAGFCNVQIFDKDGILLLAIGRASRDDRPGEYGLLSGVAVDETGRIYLVDQMFRKVEVIRPADGIKNAVSNSIPLLPSVHEAKNRNGNS